MYSTDYLFVYGTLMKGQQQPLATKLGETQDFMGEGSFPGKLYSMGWYPGAVYQEGADSKVYGHLYILKRDQASLLRALDKYEGYDPEAPNNGEFIRRLIPVNCKGEKYNAFVYLMNKPDHSYPEITSGRFEG